MLTFRGVTVACAGGNQGYRPSEDPLVLAYFERSLNEAKISYQRDYEGLYRAVDASQQGKLKKLGQASLELDPGRESLQVTAGCAAERLRDYLQGERAIYIVSREPEGAYVQMLESDFNRLGVAERYEQYQSDCAQD